MESWRYGQLVPFCNCNRYQELGCCLIDLFWSVIAFDRNLHWLAVLVDASCLRISNEEMDWPVNYVLDFISLCLQPCSQQSKPEPQQFSTAQNLRQSQGPYQPPVNSKSLPRNERRPTLRSEPQHHRLARRQNSSSDVSTLSTSTRIDPHSIETPPRNYARHCHQGLHVDR